MSRFEPILLRRCRLAVCLVAFLPGGIASAQFVLPDKAVPKTPAAAASPVTEERAKMETQLIETRRQREIELPASRELTSAESVHKADRQRLLDRLVEAGIAIPFPQRDIHLDLAQPLPVVLIEWHA